jgi:hypothetical protein
MADEKLQQVMSSSFLLVGLIIAAAVGIGLIIWLRRRLAGESETTEQLLELHGAPFWVALLSELQTGTQWKKWTAPFWVSIVTHAGNELPACPPPLRTLLCTVLQQQQATHSDVFIKKTIALLREQLEKNVPSK